MAWAAAVLPVVGSVVGGLTAKKGMDQAKKESQRSYDQELLSTLGTQRDVLSGTGAYSELGPLYSLERSQIGPWATNELLGMNTLLSGADGQSGLLGQYTSALPQLQGAQNAASSLQRGADVGDWRTLGPEAYAAMRAANPAQASLLDRMTSQAQSGLDAGTSLSPDEIYSIVNPVRADWARRGFGDSSPAQLSEALQLYGGGQQAYQTRLGNAATATGLNQSVYGSPVQELLSRYSNQGNTALGMQNAAAQLGSNLGPQIYNPESAYAGNIYGSNAGYNTEIGMARAGLYQQMGQSAGKGLGGMFSSFGSMGS